MLVPKTAVVLKVLPEPMIHSFEGPTITNPGNLMRIQFMRIAIVRILGQRIIIVRYYAHRIVQEREDYNYGEVRRDDDENRICFSDQ